MICVVGTFIKRYSNLMLVGEKTGKILSNELGMSFAETLRYINNADVPGDFLGSYKGQISVGIACDLYEAFEMIIEGYYEMLAGVYMRMNVDDDGILCKLTIECIDQSEEHNILSGKIGKRLSDKFDGKIAITQFEEDNAIYYRLQAKNAEEAGEEVHYDKL